MPACTRRALLASAIAAPLISAAARRAAALPPLPSLREQAAKQQEWLRLRLERVLPALMRQHEIDT